MLPALPLIAVGMAAAAAGWASAALWKRLQRRDDAAEPTPETVDTAARSSPGTVADGDREARPLAWCPACRTYFVASESRGCEAPDCPRAGPG